MKDLHDKLKNILAKAVKTVGGNLNNIDIIITDEIDYFKVNDANLQSKGKHLNLTA